MPERINQQPITKRRIERFFERRQLTLEECGILESSFYTDGALMKLLIMLENPKSRIHCDHPNKALSQKVCDYLKSFQMAPPDEIADLKQELTTNKNAIALLQQQIAELTAQQEARRLASETHHADKTPPLNKGPR